MTFRALRDDELELASKLMWKSFYQAEKNHTSMAGMERFRDLTDPICLAMNTFSGEICLFGAFSEEKALAVGAVKFPGHILLLYVNPEEQGRGIGEKFLGYLEGQCTAKSISVNSSETAVPFYEKNGYTVIGPVCEEEGMITRPMIKKL